MGKDETVRWMNLSLYQGAPAKKGITTVAMAASANPILADKAVRDPTLFCTGLKRQRIYMFTRSEPEYVNHRNLHLFFFCAGFDSTPRRRFCRESGTKSGERDIFNERPTREEQSIAATAPAAASRAAALASSATIHTTLGDMHLRLFPQQAPKAVENFIGHARSGYYDNVIFHRVIPKFMVQTGDPLGDGTGGTSIWDREFEDEFSDDLKHDRYARLGQWALGAHDRVYSTHFFFFFFCRPYTMSMANAGPNTNGSQFFITTNATPWLDKKHTIFGRLLSGLETVHAIENVKTNKADKPYEDIKIINIDIE